MRSNSDTGIVGSRHSKKPPGLDGGRAKRRVDLQMTTEPSLAQRTISVAPYTVDGDSEAGEEIFGVGEFFEYRGTYFVQEVEFGADPEAGPDDIAEIGIIHHFTGRDPLKAAVAWREVSGLTVALSLVTGAR